MTKVETPPTAAASDVVGEAVRGGLTSINAAGLIACSLVGAATTIYGELAGTANPTALAAVALAGWIAAIVLTLYLAGRTASTSAGQPVSGVIRQGLRVARAKPRFALLVLALTCGAAITVWSRAQSDKGGLLAAMRSDVRQGTAAAIRAESSAASAAADTSVIREQVTSQTASIETMRGDAQRGASAAVEAQKDSASAAADTRVIRQQMAAQETPAVALQRLGYQTTAEDTCRAVARGDQAVLALMARLGQPSIGINVGGGQWAACIEPALMAEGEGARVASGLKALKLSKADRDRVYVSQEIGPSHERDLDVRSLGRELVPDAGSVKLLSARAPLLSLAGWADNPGAVEALIRQGAPLDEPGRLDVSMQGRGTFGMAALAVTPLHEARRLGRTRCAQLLASAGAKAHGERREMFR